MRIERFLKSLDANFFVYTLLMVESGIRYVTFGIYKPFVFGLADWLVDELNERRHGNV